MPAGAIIAGGESTRFGDADKAVADLAGAPMIRRVADRLTGVVDALVVNCRDEQRDAIAEAMEDYPHPVSYAIDPEPDQGPMAGIRTALRGVERDTDAEYGFVAACDMPFIDPGVVELLFERARGHDAAVPRPGKWYETTHAVYRARTMADACDAALARGEGKILAPLDDLDWVVVEESALLERGPLDTFRNVNTREEFERAAAELCDR